ncbi:MAG: oligosaccharide flippase family protein [Patescibacteria group bacterium]
MQRLKDSARAKIGHLSRFFGTDMMYVVKSGFWMNANFVLVSLFGLLSSVLFARLISKDVYGTYQYILAIAGLIAVITPNNMSSAVLQSVARGNEGDLKVGTKFQMRWGAIASSVASLLSLWYAIHGNAPLAIAMIIVAIFMPAANAFNTWNAYVQGKKDYKRYFYYSTLNTVISYGGVIAMLYFTKSFIWIAFGNIFFGFIGNFLIYKMTVKQMKPNEKTDPEMIPYGRHLSIMGIPQGLVGSLDALLIFHYLGAPELAVYSFATLFPERLSGGLKFISSIAFPKFSAKSEQDVQGFFHKKIWWLLLFLAGVAALYAIFAPYLFEFLFPTYMSAVPFTRLYSLSFFGIAASFVQTALTSQKKTRELYISTVSTPFIKATLMIILMFYFGVWGVIYAQLLTTLFQIIFPIYLFKKSSVNISN